MLDHFQVGNADIFHHQERRSTHDRRGQLTVGGRSHLNRTGLGSRETHPLHQRNGKGTGSHHVGNGRPGNHTAQATGHHRRLGRAALHMAEHGVGNLDEIVAGARPLEQSTEEHKQEDEAGGNPESNTEHAFCAQPLV